MPVRYRRARNPRQRRFAPGATVGKLARDRAQRDGGELAGDATLGAGLDLRRLVGERKIEHRDAGGREPQVVARLQARVERHLIHLHRNGFRPAAQALQRRRGAGSAGAATAAGVLRRQRPGFLFLHHRRRRDDGLAHRDDQVAQHRIVELEGVLEFGQRCGVALDVHQDVVRLVHLGDRVRHLTPAPVLEAMDAAAAGRGHGAVALDHRGHLLALIGMDDKYDFVVTHADLLLVDVGWAMVRSAWIPACSCRRRPPRLLRVRQGT